MSGLREPPTKEGDWVDVFYPVTGKWRRVTAKSEPKEKDNIWYIKIPSPFTDQPNQTAVWNGKYYIYGEVGNPKIKTGKRTIISDIDGTTINDQERQLLANQNSFNNADWWAIYNNAANFNLDTPIESMRNLLNAYVRDKYSIVYLTYRPEGLRRTTEWQLHHMGFPHGELIMCPDVEYHVKSPSDFKLEVVTYLKKRGLRIERILDDDLGVAEKLGQVGYTVISPDTVHSSKENPTKIQKLQVKAHRMQKLAAEWKDQRGWKDLSIAEAESMLKSNKAVISLKFDGELEAIAVDLKKGIKVGNRRYKCVIANKTTMSRKKVGGVWREEMRTGKIRTGGPICKELIQICRRNKIHRLVTFGELYGHNLGKRVPFGDTASYIASTDQNIWRKHVRLALFDIFAVNGKMRNKKSYFQNMKFLRKKFSGNFIHVVPFKYGGIKTFRRVWRRWIDTQKNEGVVIRFGQIAYKIKPQLSVDCAIIGLKKTGVRWAEKKLASAFPCAVMDKKGNYIVCADVGNGFTDIQRAKLTKLVLKNKVRSDEKYIYCKPTVVIEVAGLEKTKSRIPSVPVFDKNLKQIKKVCGWSIRMPKMMRFRTDKSPIYKDIRAEQLYSGGVVGWQEKSLI